MAPTSRTLRRAFIEHHLSIHQHWLGICYVPGSAPHGMFLRLHMIFKSNPHKNPLFLTRARMVLSSIVPGEETKVVSGHTVSVWQSKHLKPVMFWFKVCAVYSSPRCSYRMMSKIQVTVSLSCNVSEILKSRWWHNPKKNLLGGSWAIIGSIITFSVLDIKIKEWKGNSINNVCRVLSGLAASVITWKDQGHSLIHDNKIASWKRTITTWLFWILKIWVFLLLRVLIYENLIHSFKIFNWTQHKILISLTK